MTKKHIGAYAIAALLLTAFAAAGEEWAKQSSHHEMTRMDANKDRVLTAAEHEAGAKKMFRIMDANGDGRVTPAEMDAGHRRMTSATDTHTGSQQENKRRDAAMVERHKNMRQKHKKSAAERIKAIDTDNDGVITAAEHERGAREMFTRLDTDASGSLTADEIRSGHAKMMAANDSE